jgi:quercetin dioxygenase-like cupin family protein
MQKTEILCKNFYAGLSPLEIAEEIKREGFHPIRIVDAPGAVYPVHSHPETKLLAFLEGEMEVRVGETLYHCEPGDKLFIPGNVEHSAKAGPRGCIFYWSEK